MRLYCAALGVLPAPALAQRVLLKLKICPGVLLFLKSFRVKLTYRRFFDTVGREKSRVLSEVNFQLLEESLTLNISFSSVNFTGLLSEVIRQAEVPMPAFSNKRDPIQ